MRKLKKNTKNRSRETEINRKLSKAELESAIFINWDTGRTATVVGSYIHKITLLHETGRRTQKRRHYFEYDFYLAQWTDTHALNIFIKTTEDEIDWRSEKEKKDIAHQVRKIKSFNSVENAIELVESKWAFDYEYAKIIAKKIQKEP
jgi:hypothetical protein